MAILHGKTSFTFGALVPSGKLSYAGFPPFEKIKVRFRSDDFARAFTKHADGSIKHWYILVSENGVVSPGMPYSGMNVHHSATKRVESRIRRRILSTKQDANVCK